MCLLRLPVGLLARSELANEKEHSTCTTRPAGALCALPRQQEGCNDCITTRQRVPALQMPEVDTATAAAVTAAVPQKEYRGREKVKLP